ncbi:MAG TPA: four helix bundle protein, partial [Gemmatimonadaceae bacterium]|nr:four helix bundle protein [Gemmatimonadaceae bacterium]
YRRAMDQHDRFLEPRLLAFATAVCTAARRLPADPVATNIACQLAKSASSPLANYSEARSASSPRDYANKLNHCTRELRETRNWLRLAAGCGYQIGDYEKLLAECDELIAITVTCALKARRKR